jgi:hypothetical protein
MRPHPPLLRRLRTVLLGLVLVALPACDILDPEDDEPVGLEALDRLWTRTASSNSRNDGIKILVETNAAETVVVPATSTYSIQETLWRDIRHQGDNVFSLQVLGSDDNYYEATLELNDDLTRASLEIDLGGSGSQQTWEAYPDPEGDELDRIAGRWTRTASSSSGNDGMRLEVDGSEGTVTFLPSSASAGFEVDDVLWRDITPISIVEYTFEALGSDGNYYPALMERVGSSRLEVSIVAFEGPRQTWEN